MLVLDEPTNDLALDTLEMLEARLLEFAGTVLVVSHDRAFLDNLCTSVLVFEGDGVVEEHVGDHSDWRRVVERREAERGRAEPQKRERRKESGTRPASGGGTEPSDSARGRSGSANEAAPGPKGLSYREKCELEQLPDRIQRMETELGRRA